MEQICRRCGTVLPEGSLFCPECGCQVSGQPEMAPVWQEPGLVRPPLKWFKFIIYVQLFLSALGNLVAGIQLLTRLAYGGLWASIYTFYPALRPVDAVMGVPSQIRYSFGAPRRNLASFCRTTRANTIRPRLSTPMTASTGLRAG